MRLEYPNIDGKWYNGNEKDELLKLKDKLVIGFLADSHTEVIGILRQNYTIKQPSPFGISGYYCSHYRKLTDEEMIKYTKY